MGDNNDDLQGGSSPASEHSNTSPDVWDDFPTVDIFSGSSSIQVGIEDGQSIYQDLPSNSIRLLKIVAGLPGSDICCTMQTFPLSKQLEYTALSYRWGAPPDTCPILLSGQRIMVRKNLKRFLQEARHLDHGVLGLLWIDALCVNQVNFKERGQQVSMMPEIYMTAAKVIIWLGPAYRFSDDAMDDLARSAAKKTKQRAASIYRKPSSMALSLLCLRSYWTRLWVFQEMVLAREILLMCGSKVAPWQPFHHLLLELQRRPKAAKNGEVESINRLEDSIEYKTMMRSPAMDIVPSITQQRDQTKLLDLMYSTRQLCCAEKRDKVFALLGVAAQGSQNVRPDYSLPIPVLLNRVLKSHYEVSPPEDIYDIERTCEMLAEIVGVPSETIFQLVEGHGSFVPSSSECMDTYRLGDERSDRPSLWWAVFYDHKAARDLLADDKKMHSSLAHAIEDGSQPVIQLILDSYASGHASVPMPECALAAAAQSGHETMVATLLAAEVNLSSGRPGREQAFAAAVIQRHEGIFRMLLDASKDVDAHSRNDGFLHAALWKSVKYDDVGMFQSMIQAGANMRGNADYWASLLEKVALKKREDILQIIIDNQPAFGRPPLHAVDVALKDADHPVIARTLIGLTTILEESVVKSLCLAANYGREEIVKMLLDARVATDFTIAIRDYKWDYWHAESPLSAATGKGHEGIVQML